MPLLEPAQASPARHVTGPILTAVVAALLYFMFPVSAVFWAIPLLILAVVVSALPGLWSGVAAAAIAIGYFFFGPPALAPLPLAGVDVILLGTALLVGIRVRILASRLALTQVAAQVSERRAILLAEDTRRRATDDADVGRAYQQATAEAARERSRAAMLQAALEAAQPIGIYDEALHPIVSNPALDRFLAERGEGFPDSGHARHVLETGSTIVEPLGDGRRTVTYFPLGNGDERGVGVAVLPDEPSHEMTAMRLPVAPAATEAAAEPTPEIEPHSEAEAEPEVDTVAVAQAVAEPEAAADPDRFAAPEATDHAADEEPMTSHDDANDVALGYVQELQAPVEAVREYVALVLGEAGASGGDSSPLAQYALRAMSAADELDRRVRGMSSLADATRRPLHPAPVPLADLVERTLSGLDGELDRAHARLKVDVPVELAAEADPGLLLESLTALVRNAITFVPADTRARVLIKARSVEGGRVRLSVEDNGIGMAPRFRDRLFRLFGRLPGSEEYDGIGAGLAVARAAVERMGGEIGMESEEGWGSTFWFDLPAVPAALETESSHEGETGAEVDPEIDDVIGDLTR